MAVDIDKVLKWCDDRHRKKPNAPRYSMNYPARLGPSYLDCSSMVYQALIYGGWKPSINYIGTTETLFKEKNFKEIFDYNDVQRGDIFIRGGEGTSIGAGGHTGIFYKKDGIVHCNYTNNGISYNDLSEHLTYYIDRKRSRNERYFRPIPQGSKTTVKTVTDKGYITSFAKAVIAGKYGTGNARKDNIYNAVQGEVNKIIYGCRLRNDYVTAMARDVINGKYGTGKDRKNWLYKAVQDEVNRLLK